MSLGEKRLFGFRLTKKEIDERRKSEKLRKWNEKLDRADIVKLQSELDSLNRAKFLAPQQCERKRLVERMINDLHRRNHSDVDDNNSKNIDCKLDFYTREESISSFSSDDDQDLLLQTNFKSSVLENFPIKADQFVPRALRKRCYEEKTEEKDKKRAKVAENDLLSKDTIGDKIDEFFDSL